MRLSTSLIYQNGLNGILKQEATLSRLQEQLASGRRVLTPADDPLAASLSVNLSQTSSMNATYAANRNAAKQSLGLESNALGSVVTTLQSILQRVVQAGGTLSDSDRQALVTELQSSREQLVGLANSTDGNGQFLFSGHDGFAQPVTLNSDGTVTYAGDNGQRIIQVDQSRQMAGSDVIADIFGKAASGSMAYIIQADGANTGTGQFSSVSFGAPGAGNNVGRDFTITFSDIGGVLHYTADTVPPSTPPAAPVPYADGETIDMGGVTVKMNGQPAAGDTYTVATAKDSNMDMFQTLDDLIDTLGRSAENDPAAAAAINNMLATANKKLSLTLDNVLTVQASVGARLNELDALDAVGSQRTLAYTKQLSNLEDVDVYSVTSELLLRKVALDAAAASFSTIQGSSLFSRGR
ncbi:MULTISPECIES: flagellar hook-associated protein FlgL [Bordetella]|uniref:Flagellar hook-associated protein 3 n=2 Tax=Bordetella TaxID=517 RepID=A0A261VX35_9BORD|nr:MULTISPECIES: flagellar hook-associated protein FlgL [Bordetella]MDM9562098.1 flagellar hook-associated protein FlgL [Bordetella petrii]OZI78062.1 flagellar hook-associated protein 3 [Bordetella genomosp. 2]